MESPSPHFVYNNFCRQSNVVFIIIEPKSSYFSLVKENTTIAAFGIAVCALLGVIQIKYQPENNTPFQTHPKSMTIAISSLLIYCFRCNTEHYVSFISCSSTWVTLVRNVMKSCCFISIGSFASIIFSSSYISCKTVYLLFTLLFSVKLILQWLQNRTKRKSRDGQNYNNSQRRNNVLFSNAVFNQTETLPVYHITSANRGNSISSIEIDQQL